MKPKEQILSHEALERLNRKLHREFERDMLEAETLLEQLLVSLLSKEHRKLIKGLVDFPEYFKNVQLLELCATRLNGQDE